MSRGLQIPIINLRMLQAPVLQERGREKKTSSRSWMRVYFPIPVPFSAPPPLYLEEAGSNHSLHSSAGEQPVAWVQSTDKSSMSFSPKTSGLGS